MLHLKIHTLQQHTQKNITIALHCSEEDKEDPDGQREAMYSDTEHWYTAW